MLGLQSYRYRGQLNVETNANGVPDNTKSRSTPPMSHRAMSTATGAAAITLDSELEVTILAPLFKELK